MVNTIWQYSDPIPSNLLDYSKRENTGNILTSSSKALLVPNWLPQFQLFCNYWKTGVWTLKGHLYVNLNYFATKQQVLQKIYSYKTGWKENLHTSRENWHSYCESVIVLNLKIYVFSLYIVLIFNFLIHQLELFSFSHNHIICSPMHKTILSDTIYSPLNRSYKQHVLQKYGFLMSPHSAQRNIASLIMVICKTCILQFSFFCISIYIYGTSVLCVCMCSMYECADILQTMKIGHQ